MNKETRPGSGCTFRLGGTAPLGGSRVAAYTFELSKCWETAIKERALKVLANIDGELCAQVAAGLGLPTVTSTDPLPSPVLSQLDNTWPLDGRTIVTEADQGLTEVRSARRAVLDADMVPLVIAPAGGVLDHDGEPVSIQRTFANARSTEFDALLLAGAPAAGADAYGARDAKVDDDVAAAAGLDPRVLVMVMEAYRHGKVLGAWGEGTEALAAAGIAPDAPGVVSADTAAAMLEQLFDLLARHRAWDRFTPSI
ncbi:catalase-related domain-containing protein [Streptomyces sp. NPDC059371]|uniref:catalase-related domain-containing protein n=1 Tax=Streptomyces sp. NPDC059371 TaxID=3346812 RepID=UPI003686ABC1